MLDLISPLISNQTTPPKTKLQPIMTDHAHTPQGTASLSHLEHLQGSRQAGVVFIRPLR